MAEIYQYSVAILIGVAIFGAILGLLRLRHARKMRSAEGLIRKLEGTAVRDPEGDRRSALRARKNALLTLGVEKRVANAPRGE